MLNSIDFQALFGKLFNTQSFYFIKEEKMKYLKSCRSCISNKGEKRISPAKPIYKGKYWRIEHAYPCGLKGWLIFLPNRDRKSVV